MKQLKVSYLNKYLYFLVRCGIQYIGIFLCTNRCCKTCWWCSKRTRFQIISKDLHYWDCSVGSDWKQKWPCWKRCKDELPKWNNDLPHLLLTHLLKHVFALLCITGILALLWRYSDICGLCKIITVNKLQNANVLQEELVLKYLILFFPLLILLN